MTIADNAKAVATRRPRRARTRRLRPAGKLPHSLRDTAYEAIKHRIITCAYRPGEYINELRVSRDLNIGRTPVHQAIGQLMHEGMLEVMPRKGVIIKPLSLDEILEIVEVRMMAETFCVRLAAERATDKDVAGLEAILARAEEVRATHDVERLMALDRDFHVALARAARNNVLAEILRRLHERSLRFWFVSLTNQSRHDRVHAEHGAIVEALRARDAEGAVAAMRAHIDSFRQNILTRI